MLNRRNLEKALLLELFSEKINIMIRKKSDYIKTFDGKNNHLIHWFDDEKEPLFVVHIVHGMAEYADRYDHFARFLCSNGITVFANDHRGHGFTQTDGKLGFFEISDGWNYVVKDLKTIEESIKEKYPTIPYIMLGHSMGSFLARTFAIKYPKELDALILSGTGFHPGKILGIGKSIAYIQKALFKATSPSYLLNYLTFGSYNKTYKNKKTKFDFLSRDESVVKKYIEDPLCGFVCPNSFFIDLINGLDFIHEIENVEKMNKSLPILLAFGSEDPVGNFGKGVEEVNQMFLNQGIKRVQVKIYKEARHEIINEINKEEVYNDLLNWIYEIFSKSLT